MRVFVERGVPKGTHDVGTQTDWIEEILLPRRVDSGTILRVGFY